MNFCSNCGTQLGDGQAFCPNCGFKVGETTLNGTPVSGQQPTAQYQYTAPAAPTAEYPMKWFKFLIYFSLFAAALLNLVNGVNFMTGAVYFAQSNGETSAAMIYGIFGIGLKIIDMVYGFLLIALAGFNIYTRFRLAKYRKDGPMCYYITCGAAIGLSLLYYIGVFAVTGINSLSGSGIGSLVASAVLLFVNYKYFTKRKALFCK